MRQSILNLCVLGLVAMISVLGASSWAKSAERTNSYTAEAMYDSTTHELIVKVTEVAKSSAACDLVLTSLSYSAASPQLTLKLDADFCPMDIVGHRSGTAKWQVPLPLRGSGEIVLEVNGEVLGTIILEQDSARIAR